MAAKYVSIHDTNAPTRAAKTKRTGFGPNVFANESVMREAPPQLEIQTGDFSEAAVADVARDPSTVALARVMPLKLIKPVAVDNDPQNTEASWGLEAVGADADLSVDGEEVAVAVLDTGIDKDHPAFAGITLERRDFTGEGDDDIDGHGTHCAGTIFGRDVNGTRIGVARGVRRALIGKVIGGDAGTDALINAIKWASDRGAHVISMSLGYDHVELLQVLKDRMPEEQAISEVLQIYRENIRLFDRLMDLLSVERQMKHGVVIVAASGNESRADDPNRPFRVSAASPSAAEGVIPVGALAKGQGDKFKVAPFSNTNVEIAAPGVDIISARAGGGLTSMSGTSMACPHVAGLAALHWSDIIRRQLLAKADTVMARLKAAAKVEAMDTTTASTADFGLGIAIAPQAG